MKIRTSFVTNSSSANYVVEFQLKSGSGATVSYEISTENFPSGYEGRELYEVLFKWGWPIEALDLWHPILPEKGSLEDVITALIGCVEVEPYPEGIILDTMNFFIVGEPTKYESREALERFIVRNGGAITELKDADFAILCGDDKQRFSERWPWGYSLMEMSDEEAAEVEKDEDVIRAKIKKELIATQDSWADGPWDLNTGDLFYNDYDDGIYSREGWKGWTLATLIHDAIPLMSEEEFAFFDPNGPAGHGALSAMPGAVETLVKKCVEAGITRENLRIIGGRFFVSPFGESAREVEEREYQWDINVKEDKIRSCGEWDWQDTVWWPLEDNPASATEGP